MHDVLDQRDLVPDEAEHLATSGFPAQELWERAREAAERSDLGELGAISVELGGLRRPPGWAYEEPSDEEAIVAELREGPLSEVDVSTLEDRILGAWLGRCVGCTMGKPVEGLTVGEVNRYLDAVAGWPEAGFLPLLEQLPTGVSPLNPTAASATLGNFDSVPRDDDIDWTILGLHNLELYGRHLKTEDIAREWLDRLPFTQTFTAERAAYRNLVMGVPIPDTARVQNPYREWIGGLIRGDIFGYVNPGRPLDAARLAFIDARLSHVANGIYGEMWSAALIASALVCADAESALLAAAACVPPKSRLYETQSEIIALFRAGASSSQALAWVNDTLGHYSWVHTLNNAALITIGLLWGRGDFVQSVAICIRGGLDTDSDAATVGSALGALFGSEGVPSRLWEAFGNRVRSSVREFDGVAIDELAARTRRLVSA